MTIRVKETGKTTIVSYAEIAQGKFSVTSEDGDYVETDRTGGGSGKVTMTGSDGSAYLSGPEAAAKVFDWVMAAAYPGAPQPSCLCRGAPGKQADRWELLPRTACRRSPNITGISKAGRI
jgi:hypothetical protein